MIEILNYTVGAFIKGFALFIVMFDTSMYKQIELVRKAIIFSNDSRKIIPSFLCEAVIEIEDRRFFSHLGIDCYSMIRALIKNITTNRLEGASTIVQQLVRNITNQRELKLTRKIREIILAVIVNKEFTKEEIFFAYLTTYPFNKSMGLFSFCENEKYNLENLTPYEANEIAARLKYPALHSKNYINYLKRVRAIERKIMNRCGTDLRGDKSSILKFVDEI